jgi:hypothetical protein
VQKAIYIRDDLMLEAHPDGRHIMLRREGEPGAVRIYLNEVRYLAEGLLEMASGRWR